MYKRQATENIIDKVTHYMLPDGEEREFTKADKDKVEEQMHAQMCIRDSSYGVDVE